VLDEAELAGIPKLTIKVFGDIPYHFMTDGHGEVKHEFHSGVAINDLFFIGAITDQLTVLLENTFHFHDDGLGTIHNHLERTQATYAFSELANLTVGMGHTPLGYWNQTFHHGNWLQTTIERPDVYEFERPRTRQGGILPVHFMGVNLHGMAPFELADVAYNLGLYNGRENNRSISQGWRDENDFKAINTLVSVAPHAIEGLKVGADVYIDKIPTNRAITGNLRDEEIDELILGGHGAYVHGGAELLAEFFHITHDDHQSEQTFKTLGGYVQGSYKLGKLTPYTRLDLIAMGDGDPFYQQFNVTTGAFLKRDPINDHRTYTLGLRWDVFAWNALKFETSYIDNHDNLLDEYQLAVNTSYVF
jgi:hypothetical protein